MIERIIENFPFLNLILTSESKHKRLELNSEEMSVLKASIEILKPFYGITCQISSESTCTSSMIIPTLTVIKKSLSTNSNNNFDDFSEGFKEMLELYSDFYVKKYSLLENRQLILSAFLNPKYKKFSHATDEQKKSFLKTS